MFKLANFAAIVLVSLVFAAPLSAAQTRQREYATGQAGSLPSEDRLLAGFYFDKPPVRRLIQSMEDGPASRAEILAALEGTEVAIDDLLRVRLVREENARFYIDFSYFNADDMRAVYAAADRHVPALVEAYADRRAEFDALFADYPAESVGDEWLGFVLIAGMSLNWDGLEIAEDEGWRRPELVTGRNGDGEAWGYSFWASEVVEERSNRGFYWGSSTFPGGPFNYETDPVDFSFASFGDPYSDPRMNFPDLMYLPGEAMTDDVHAAARRIGLEDRRALGFELSNALGLDIGRSIGPILFALRERPLTESALSGIVEPEHAAKTGALLDLLETVQYVRRDGDRYVLLVPALDCEDREMVEAALALSREILIDWMRTHYDAIRTELSDLTALRHGVPYESLFTQIWHDLFGLTTRELVARGVIGDPESDSLRHQGSYPMVWRLALYDFDPG